VGGRRKGKDGMEGGERGVVWWKGGVVGRLIFDFLFVWALFGTCNTRNTDSSLFKLRAV